MTYRGSSKFLRKLRPRGESVNYLDEESEGEIDYVYEESELSEYSFSDDDDSENEQEDRVVQEEETLAETGGQSSAGSRKKKLFMVKMATSGQRHSQILEDGGQGW